MAESVRNPEGKFYYHYREAWSFADMDELRLHCETGGTAEEAATLPARWRKCGRRRKSFG
jgi:hypothetical protein